MLGVGVGVGVGVGMGVGVGVGVGVDVGGREEGRGFCVGFPKAHAAKSERIPNVGSGILSDSAAWANPSLS
jgi:hypothetical protein